MNRRGFLQMAVGQAAATALALGQEKQDWAQWRGPERSGISGETGLLRSWPAAGPAKLWTIDSLGGGYGSLALAGDRIYVQAGRGGQSMVVALEREGGKEVWKTPLGEKLAQDRGDGPRGTPTVVGDQLFALSENGDLACMRTGDGSVVWKKNILTEFGGRNPHWLISESPLLEDEKLIVTPGGKGTSVVALDRRNGKKVWASEELSDPAGYASCIVADVAGQRAVMTLNARAGVGVNAKNGKLLWRYERAANGTANCTTPVHSGGKVFYTSAYGTGGGLVKVLPADGNVKMEEVYFTRDMQNHHGGVILHNGHIYGFSNAILTCLEWETGAPKWKDRSVGKGTVSYADGRLYMLSERNVMGLAEATPDGYKEAGRFEIPDQGLPSWAHPVVCGGRLYIRNQGWLGCFDIRA